MLIIKVESSIDKALKQYKRKWNNAKLSKQIRERQQYTKPSVKRRAEKNKAEYVARKRRENE